MNDGDGSDFMRARSYSPTLGTFSTPDPFGSLGPPYLYANENPTTFIDPLGLRAASNQGSSSFYVEGYLAYHVSGGDGFAYGQSITWSNSPERDGPASEVTGPELADVGGAVGLGWGNPQYTITIGQTVGIYVDINFGGGFGIDVGLGAGLDLGATLTMPEGSASAATGGAGGLGDEGDDGDGGDGRSTPVPYGIQPADT